MKILKARLLERRLEERERELAAIKGEHVEAGWGNQIRSYVLHPYQMVKDHRTEHETSDTSGVLDGDLDRFMLAELERVATERPSDRPDPPPRDRRDPAAAGHGGRRARLPRRVLRGARGAARSHRRSRSMPRNPLPLGRLFAHLIATDPERCWVAEAPTDDVVGLRPRASPRWDVVPRRSCSCGQPRRPPASGNGSSTRAWPRTAQGAACRAVCAEAIQPVSTGAVRLAGHGCREPRSTP